MLLAAWPELAVEMVHIITSGDRFTDRPLADIGGKGLFTKEIEETLLAGDIDIAVHSVKDMETTLPDKLAIGCMPAREDARDVLIGAASLADIPQKATFGTASLRRAAQMLIKRPDLKIVPLRGNVQTRLKKIEEGEIQATLLAKAGLNRLGLETGTVLPVAEFIPAAGQGALGIECRADDTHIHDLLAPLKHADTEAAVACERAFLRTLDGSCRTPIAGHATVKDNVIHFTGLLAAPDGSRHQTVSMKGVAGDAESLGLSAGKELKAKF